MIEPHDSLIPGRLILTLRMNPFNPETCRYPQGHIREEWPAGWRIAEDGNASPIFIEGAAVAHYFISQPGHWWSTPLGDVVTKEEALRLLTTAREVLERQAAHERRECGCFDAESLED